MNEKTFEQAWALKEAEGYQYGPDALEQVRFGWEMAMAESKPPADPRDLPASAGFPERFAKGLAELKARRGPATIPCLACGYGIVFGDARGGYECTACDARFHIQREHPQGYGGPSGSLTVLEQIRAWVGLWLLPKERTRPARAEANASASPVATGVCPICKASPDEDCDAGLHS